MFEKIVIVTRKTRLAELIDRFNTRAQAKFYIEHSGADFSEYEAEADTYSQALQAVEKKMQVGIKVQIIPREFVPSFTFTEKDLIVTLGQDGLVANTAKYVGAQPIIAINPDPKRFDGVLLPVSVANCGEALGLVLSGKAPLSPVILAKATLNDGQSLLAFNDFFIGPSSHISLRYKIHYCGKSEQQSSSGIVVSTGAGSTGWMSSIFEMVNGVSAAFGGSAPPAFKMEWNCEKLVFVVREPFKSKHSSTEIVAGTIDKEQPLAIESQMPSGGIIFSDGMEKDFLNFNSGATATISIAPQTANLVRL